MSATRAPDSLVTPGSAALFTGRAAYVISQLYYYLVAIVAVGFVMGGVIAGSMALRELAFPDPGAVTRSSVRFLLQGLAFAVPGAVTVWWHLAEARRGEGRVAPGASWGRSLYFHGVAFVAYPVALGGIVATMLPLINAVSMPECPIAFGGLCADTGDAFRSAANGAIIVLVSGAVWWWHLRNGRRIVVPEVWPSDPMEGR